MIVDRILLFVFKALHRAISRDFIISLWLQHYHSKNRPMHWLMRKTWRLSVWFYEIYFGAELRLYPSRFDCIPF